MAPEIDCREKILQGSTTISGGEKNWFFMKLQGFSPENWQKLTFGLFLGVLCTETFLRVQGCASGILYQEMT